MYDVCVCVCMCVNVRVCGRMGLVLGYVVYVQRQTFVCVCVFVCKRLFVHVCLCECVYVCIIVPVSVRDVTCMMCVLV